MQLRNCIHLTASFPELDLPSKAVEWRPGTGTSSVIHMLPPHTFLTLQSLSGPSYHSHRCIECGFCESNCPSRDITLTPRQRITVFREMHRLATLPQPSEAEKQRCVLSLLLKDVHYVVAYVFAYVACAQRGGEEVVRAFDDCLLILYLILLTHYLNNIRLQHVVACIRVMSFLLGMLRPALLCVCGKQLQLAAVCRSVAPITVARCSD